MRIGRWRVTVGRATPQPFDWERECPELRLPKEGHVERVYVDPFDQPTSREEDA